MGGGQAKPEEEQRKDLNLYFKNLLETKLQFQRSAKEVQGIQYAVNVLVETIASALGELNNSLKILRVVRVGSMTEETKIREPDEFDFLLVLEYPSQPRAVEIVRERKNGSGYKHIVIKDEYLKSQWSHCMYGDMLKGTISSKISYFFYWLFGYDIGLRQEFYKTLQQVLASVRTSNGSCQTDTGVMTLSRTLSRHGPAFTSVLYWTPSDKNSTSLQINVDLTPAIQLELSEEILKESEVYDQRFYQALKQVNRYMVVPCNRASSCRNGLCFRLTFTETEVQLLSTRRDELCFNPQFPDYTWLFSDSVRLHHIQCYKVMKYIFESDSAYRIEIFKSYTLKTFLLKHMCHCKNDDDISSCVMDLSNDCLQAMDGFQGSRLQISGIFVTEHSIFHKKKIHSPPYYFIKAIKDMVKSLVRIGKGDDYRSGSVKKVNRTVRQLSQPVPGQVVQIF